MSRTAYHRVWRKKNRKKQQVYWQAYRRKNRLKLQAYHRQWAQKHKTIVNKGYRDWCRKNRRREIAIRNRSRQKRRQEIITRWGGTCFICGTTAGLHVHHRHSLQKKQKCCTSPNGCNNCRVVVLCRAHNHGVGLMGCGQDIQALKKFRQIWRKHNL